MKDIHDLTFKRLMEEPEFLQNFFQQYLPIEVTQGIDWPTAQVLKLSGEHIQEVFPFEGGEQIRWTKNSADLTYLVDTQVGDYKTLLNVHIEHQSTPDRYLPLRLSLYLIGMLYEYAKMNQTDVLPPVYSI